MKNTVEFPIEDAWYFLDLLQYRFQTFNLGKPKAYSETGIRIVDLLAKDETNPQKLEELKFWREYWEGVADLPGSGIWQYGGPND